jgi:hypothetical protein
MNFEKQKLSLVKKSKLSKEAKDSKIYKRR